MNEPSPPARPRALALLAEAAYWAAALAIVLAAAKLRWENLSAGSMWFDEQNVIRVCQVPLGQGFFPALRNHVYAFPADYLIVKAFRALPGLPDLTLRLPSFLFGVGAVALAAGYGRFIYGKMFGLALAGLIAVSALHIEYSQELRFYSSMFFCTLLVALLALDLWQRPTRRRLYFFAALTAIAYQFHLMMAMSVMIFFASAGLNWAIRRLRRERAPEGAYGPRDLAIVAALLLAACLPALKYFVLDYRHELDFKNPPEGVALFWDLFARGYAGFERSDLARFFTAPQRLAPSVALAIAVWIACLAAGLAFRRELLIHAAFALLFAVALYASVVRSKQYFAGRHYFFLLPVILIVLSAGADAWSRLLRGQTRKLWAARAARQRVALAGIALLAAYGAAGAVGAGFYGRAWMNEGLKFARLGSHRKLDQNYRPGLPNCRAAIEFALRNTASEMVFCPVEGYTGRALRAYLEECGYPKDRVLVIEPKDLAGRIADLDSFWVLGEVPKALDRPGHALKLMNGVSNESFAFVRKSRPIAVAEMRGFAWKPDDCGILLSYFQHSLQGEPIERSLALASQMIDAIPQVRPGSYRKALCERFAEMLRKEWPGRAPGEQSEISELARRCVELHLKEGFERAPGVTLNFIAALEGAGEPERAYALAREDFARFSGGKTPPQYRQGLATYMVQRGVRHGLLTAKDARELRAAITKDGAFPDRDRLLQMLERFQPAR